MFASQRGYHLSRDRMARGDSQQSCIKMETTNSNVYGVIGGNATVVGYSGRICLHADKYTYFTYVYMIITVNHYHVHGHPPTNLAVSTTLGY